MNDIATLRRILGTCKTIAVVGLSPQWHRPSFFAAKYMQAHGYRIVPVNPTATEILGERCYPSVTVAATALAQRGEKIDLVDCFRRSEDILPIADEAIAIGARCLWMQIGVINEQAAAKASGSGLDAVMGWEPAREVLGWFAGAGAALLQAAAPAALGDWVTDRKSVV